MNRSDPFKEPFGETNGLQNGRRNGQRGTGGYGVGTESEGGSPIVTVNIQNELNMYKNKRNQLEKNRREKNIISSLVTLRERKKGMRETVERCLRVCERGDTGDQQNGTSSLSELVFVCLESIEENRTEVEQRRTRTQNLKVQSDDSASNNGSDAGSTNQSSGNDHSKRSGTPDIGKERGLESDEREREHRAWLSSQLMAHPETFLAILDILGE